MEPRRGPIRANSIAPDFKLSACPMRKPCMQLELQGSNAPLLCNCCAVNCKGVQPVSGHGVV